MLKLKLIPIFIVILMFASLGSKYIGKPIPIEQSRAQEDMIPRVVNPMVSPPDLVIPTIASTQDAPLDTNNIATNEVIFFNSDRDGNYGIYRMDTAGNDQTRLTTVSTPDLHPQYSFAANKILFDSDMFGHSNIFVMNTDGSGRNMLTTSSDNEFWASWSPDGSQIAYTRAVSGKWEIYLMDADGSNQRQLTYNNEFSAYPTWSRNGTKIAFMRSSVSTLACSVNWDIYVINVDGSGQTQITTNSFGDMYPSWSHANDNITYTGCRYSFPSYVPHIWVMSGTGANKTRLTTHSRGEWASSWSPDGTKIIFASSRSDSDEVYVMDSNGNNQTNLTQSPNSSETASSWGYYGTLTHHTISGTIVDDSGNPIAGVTVSTDNGYSATSDSNGEYTITNLITGTRILVPTKFDYTFSPPSLTVSVPPDATQADFTAITQTPTPTSSPIPTVTPSATPIPINPTWTFLVYLACDADAQLDTACQQAINRLQQAAANPHIKILALYDKPGANNGVRYHIQPNGSYTDGVNRWHLGEINTAHPDTLASFITWGRQNYPAEQTALVILGHGLGHVGIGWDLTTGSQAYLTPTELRAAIYQGTAFGAEPFDLVFYDACLMGLLEHAYQLDGLAQVMVAAENLAWLPFPYQQLNNLVDATTTPRQLASDMVAAYAAAYSHRPYTISALDLTYLDPVVTATDVLAQALQANMVTQQTAVQNSRTAAQKFNTHDFNTISNTDAYLDLYDLAHRLQSFVPEPTIQAAAADVKESIGQAGGDFIIAEAHASGFYTGNDGNQYYWDLDNAQGVAIYFPHTSGGPGFDGYMTHQFQFTIDTHWNNFLTEYYGVLGPPPDPGGDPELPPVLVSDYRLFLPAVVR